MSISHQPSLNTGSRPLEMPVTLPHTRASSLAQVTSRPESALPWPTGYQLNNWYSVCGHIFVNCIPRSGAKATVLPRITTRCAILRKEMLTTHWSVVKQLCHGPYGMSNNSMRGSRCCVCAVYKYIKGSLLLTNCYLAQNTTVLPVKFLAGQTRQHIGHSLSCSTYLDSPTRWFFWFDWRKGQLSKIWITATKKASHRLNFVSKCPSSFPWLHKM